MRLALKAVIAVSSSLLLLQIEVGYYGLWLNWLLLIIVVLAAFNLGYWGIE